MTGFTQRVYDVVRRIPRGKVASYGGVAAILGRPRAARGVGRALSVLSEDSDVPWWRVINRSGEISIKGLIHGPALQRALLEAEGVRFRAGRADWRRYGWDASDLPASLRPDEAQETSEPAVTARSARRGRRRSR